MMQIGISSKQQERKDARRAIRQPDLVSIAQPFLSRSLAVAGVRFKIISEREAALNAKRYDSTRPFTCSE